jgi:hypothetical protein
MGRACYTNERKKSGYRLFVGKPKGRDSYGSQYLCGWIILRWITKKIV